MLSAEALHLIKNWEAEAEMLAALDEPDALASDAAVQEGNGILGHLLGSKDVSRNVAAQAAGSTGIDSSLIKKALPLIAGLAMGAFGNQADPEVLAAWHARSG